jgi:membrane protease YdiL (CAAX protease family)
MAESFSPVSAQVLRRALIPTAVLAGLLLAVTWESSSVRELAVAVPVFCLLYGALFTVGQEPAAAWLHRWIGDSTGRAIAPPAAVIAVLYTYCAVGGGNPVQRTGLVLPALLLLPVLALHARRGEEARLGTTDLAVLVLLLIALPDLRLPVNAKIPFSGGGFDPATRVVMMVVVVYAFVAVRGVREVGMVMAPRWRPLAATLALWLVLLPLCVAAATVGGLVSYVGHGPMTIAVLRDDLRECLFILLHTALFEELFCRGLLQNMVAQRIAQAGQWRTAWRVFLAILLPLALVAGYTLTVDYGWLPAVVCVALFAAADRLERRGRQRLGDYAALAIVGTAFGLAHYHAHSVAFIAMAMIAGWTNGYLYLRTRNLLYPVLLHALINSSPVFFGLAMVK